MRSICLSAMLASSLALGLSAEAQNISPQLSVDGAAGAPAGDRPSVSEPPSSRPYRIKIGMYPGLSWPLYTHLTVAEFFREVQKIIEEKDGSDDIDCAPNIIAADGDPENFPVELPHVLDSPDAFDKLSLGGYGVLIVEGIEWCGGPAAGSDILGCAAEYGPIVIARHGASATIIWAHEMGHAQGLKHFPAHPENLMFPMASPSMRKLTPGQCNAYRRGQVFAATASPRNFVPQPSARLRDVQALEQGAPPSGQSTDPGFERVMSSAWIHTPPFDRLDAFTPEQIEQIRGFIRNKQFAYWPNSVLALGYLGGPDDVELLKTVLDEPVDSRPEIIRAKINTGRALGWLAQIHKSAPAALMLSELMYPREAIKHFRGSPTAEADARAAARQAATGAAYVRNPQLTGAIQHQQNSAARGDINLHVGSGFYDQLYQIQQEAAVAPDTREYLRNSQKRFFEQ